MMKLRFVFAPVAEVESSVIFYRDELGWIEAWREGAHTVAFQVPGSSVQVMVDDQTVDQAGPMYEVDDLSVFMAEHPCLVIVRNRSDIPGGSIIGYRDPGNNTFYVFDQVSA